MHLLQRDIDRNILPHPKRTGILTGMAEKTNSAGYTLSLHQTGGMFHARKILVALDLSKISENSCFTDISLSPSLDYRWLISTPAPYLLWRGYEPWVPPSWTCRSGNRSKEDRLLDPQS
jgi:hypothetical protein